LVKKSNAFISVQIPHKARVITYYDLAATEWHFSAIVHLL